MSATAYTRLTQHDSSELTPVTHCTIQHADGSRTRGAGHELERKIATTEIGPTTARTKTMKLPSDERGASCACAIT